MNSEQETRKKITELIRGNIYLDKREMLSPDILTTKILSLLKGLGYRKVPELKVLSDEEIRSNWIKTEHKLGFPNAKPDPEEDFVHEKAVAQAQVDRIKRQIEEANADT